MKRRLFSSGGSSPQAQSKRSCLTQSGGRGDGVRLTKGQSVYVYSQEEAWKEGVVLEVDPSHNVVTIMLEDTGQVSSYSMDEVLLCWEKQAVDPSNLTHVNPVHEATVLSCLQRRFEAGLYYTNAGNTVVAVNPCTDVSHLYTLPVIRAYHQRQQGLPPHIYTVGENAHMNMVRELGQVNQSIVISGESGAGKTVSAKHLLRYLTIVANPAAEKLNVDDKGFQIEQRVVDSNPILEAFGNAATTRNDNSSRFGKFIQLQFLRNGQIQGGAIHTYLLEKTRVMHQSHGDNNFHVFYQMMKTKEEEEEKKEEEEEEEEDYADWVQELRNEVADTCFLCVPHHQDCQENRELRDTLQAMTRVGLSQQSQRDVFQVLLAILYLGNLSFVQISDDSSDLDGSLCSSSQSDCQDSEDSFFEVSVCGQALERSSHLLGLTPDLLRMTLLHRSLQAGGRQRQSFFLKPVTISEAGSRRDVLAMLLYCRLFEWLVDFINSRIKAEVSDYVIGLLDIYGFEIFPFNSLEQLCINYANERLQQHYVAHFLKNLQMEYEEECIPWEPMDYNDNRPCLSLLDGRLSVFSLLNEEVYLNRRSDVEGLRDRLLKLETPSDYCLRSPPLSASPHPSFVVQHYAGDVHYTVADLVPKNKDDIPADLISLLTSSHNAFIHQLFASYSQPESPLGRKKKTVLTKFKSSLDELMSSLEESEVHYIRCLRPNISNTAGVFQPPYLLQQLRACGTIQSINIYRQGFPAKTPYKEFLERYSLILRSEYRVLADSGDGVDSEDDDNSKDVEEGEEGEAEKEAAVCDPGDVLPHQEMDFALPSCTTAKKTISTRTGLQAVPQEQARKVCGLILQHVVSGLDLQQLQQRQFGRSKIFLTEQQLEQLECARLAVLHYSATVLQSCWRGQCCRRRYRHLLAATAIHRAWLTFRIRQHFLAVKQAASVLQRTWRALQSRRKFVAVKRATVVLQRAWSSVLVRRHFLDLRQRMVIVQAAWRRYRARKEFVGLKRSAAVIQKAWRVWRTRRQPLQLEKASRTVQKDTQPQLTIDTPHRQLPAEETQEVTMTPQPLTPAEESSLSVAVQSSDSSRRSVCPTSQTVPGLLDLSPAVDGNWSDDSGVMVHEPHQPQSHQERRGARQGGKERGGAVERGGPMRCQVVMSVAAAVWPRLQGVLIGDGVVSWRRIPKSGVRFHTRASVLRYGHVINRWELPLGLPDILTDVPYGGWQLGSAVD